MQETGLAVALDELATKTSRLTSLNVSFEERGDVTISDPEKAMHLYRIAQEALNNSVRHSGCTEVRILLERRQDRLCLSVADNGKGLPEHSEVSDGMGLKTMNYRARTIGANLQVESSMALGTHVVCVIPCDFNLADNFGPS
jgi:signal transduction histidine kinase